MFDLLFDDEIVTQNEYDELQNSLAFALGLFDEGNDVLYTQIEDEKQ